MKQILLERKRKVYINLLLSAHVASVHFDLASGDERATELSHDLMNSLSQFKFDIFQLYSWILISSSEV